jgi:hypothetical protein
MRVKQKGHPLNKQDGPFPSGFPGIYGMKQNLNNTMCCLNNLFLFDLSIFQVLRKHQVYYFHIVYIKKRTDANNLLHGKVINFCSKAGYSWIIGMKVFPQRTLWHVIEDLPEFGYMSGFDHELYTFISLIHTHYSKKKRNSD